MDQLKIEKSRKHNYGDFPLYNDQPFALTTGKWWLWLIVTLLGYAFFTGILFIPAIDILKKFRHPSESAASSMETTKGLLIAFFISLLLLIVSYFIVLGIFRYISRHEWRLLFKKPTRGGVLYGVIGGVLLFLFFVGYSYILSNVFHIKMQDDAVTKGSYPLWYTILNFIMTLIQLMLEEMWKIVPFLFLLHFSYKKLRWDRKTSIWVSWILSCLLFGLYHWSAYDGNLLQMFLVISVSAFAGMTSYIRYKNIWVAYLMHACYDFIPLFMVVLDATMKK